MIDEYWTWQFYGYHSDELTPHSHRLIVVRCDECCQYRVVMMQDYRDLCRSCARKGERNSMYGRRGKSAPAYGRHGTDHPNWKGGKQVVHCFTCGASIEVSYNRANTVEHHFCSADCQRPFISARISAWFADETNHKAHAAAKKMYYTNPVNREKHSAAAQGIPYEEWEGFAKDDPYCPAFDETCRESNREKYDRRCFLCGADEADNISSTNKHKKLAVHHVDMNKQQGCDGHAWKLVPLCMWCHSSAHGGLTMDRIIYLLEHVWNKD